MKVLVYLRDEEDARYDESFIIDEKYMKRVDEIIEHWDDFLDGNYSFDFDLCSQIEPEYASLYHVLSCFLNTWREDYTVREIWA